MLMALVLAGLIQAPALTETQPRILGVLETPQVEQGPPVAARLLFRRVKGRWWPLKAEEARAANPSGWAVTFRGQGMGTVDLLSSGDAQEEDLREGLLRSVQDASRAPKVMEGAETFGGWMRAADRRPLVIQSTPPASDPERWTAQSAPGGIAGKLWPFLRKAWGRWRPYHCPKNPEKAEPLRVGPKDLRIHSAFQSRSGRWIVAVGLDPAAITCDGILDPEGTPHWFLVDGARVRFLGRELAWVDAGDFGGTGRSDILFARAGYNADGYVLWTDGLTRKVEVLWSYH